MIEVKDEILDGEPLYRIRDEQGNILQDNVTIEMITEPIQEGTPLNKALFDSVEDDLNEKLNISDKATIEEAKTGEDDTNYTTPLTVLQSINVNALPSKHFSIKTGTVNDKATIPQTSGYKHYMYMVSPKQVGYRTLDGMLIKCEVNQSTRKVIVGCYSDWWQSPSGKDDEWRGWVSGTATYIEFAWN